MVSGRRGFTLIEVVIAFTIFVLATTVLYQSLSLISNRLSILKKGDREEEYVEILTKVYYLTKKGDYRSIEKLDVGFERRYVDCSAGNLGKSLFFNCPYETFNPINPRLPQMIHNVRQIIILEKLRFLTGI